MRRRLSLAPWPRSQWSGVQRGRFGQASVWTGTELLVWDGVEDSQRQPAAGDAAAYDPATRAWTPMPASPLSPRNSAFAVWTGTQMVVIQPGAGAAFDPATSTWTTVPALPEVAGWQPFAVRAEWTGSEVITWVASRSPAGGLRFSADSWVPRSPAWTPVPGQPDDAAFPFGTAASVGGRILFLGGSTCRPGPLPDLRLDQCQPDLDRAPVDRRHDERRIGRHPAGRGVVFQAVAAEG